MTTINTVTGPIDSSELGFTLMHEHVMVSAPGMFRSFPDLFGPDDPLQRAIDTFQAGQGSGCGHHRRRDHPRSGKRP